MIPAGFHDEWLTIGRHRVYIRVRCGFLGARERRRTEFVAELIEAYSGGAHSRAVQQR